VVWRFHALTAPDSNWGSKKSSPRTEYEQCGRFLLRVLQVGHRSLLQKEAKLLK